MTLRGGVFQPIFPLIDSLRGIALHKKVTNMSDTTDTRPDDDTKYLLVEREMWESLEFDWQDWNATVEKILQQQARPIPQDED